MRAEQRDRSLLGTIAALDMQRFARAFFFVFTRTKRVLRRMPHSGFGNFMGLGSADVDDAQTESAPNSGVRTKAMSESVMSTIDADLLTDRTVDNRHRRSGKSSHVNAMNAELFLAHGFNTSQHHREIGGVTSRHNRI